MTRTWRRLRDEARERLGDDQEVRWIVEQASGLTAAEQVAVLDGVADERQAASFEAMVERRHAGEPLQYVLGQWGFRTLDLYVDPRVLIPRPETEVVAGIAIDAVPAGGRVVDLGTGSGAIALSIAAERWPDVEVWATDASPGALTVARANTAALGRRGAVVRLVEGDWYDALPEDLRGTFDVVVANPPYVPDDALVARQVRDHEPALALYGGADGLDHIRTIVGGAPDWLRGEGTLVVEIGDDQGAAAADLARAAGFDHLEVRRDLTKRDRALVARRG
ncbi:MAG TPA: peptide chain release factor N(5)-glutamine methyltransferase [Acidimicrobiales bacterium]|nr:peptide chain release factor N(5)-glutamine methyltransferase [Acidimicrobiales bacterium]